MTYQTALSRTLYASPRGMCLATQTLNQTPSTGGVISFSGTIAMKGTLHNDISFSSGSIVLPSGYWYYLDASTEFHLVTTYNVTAYAKTQWYNGSTAIGTEGLNGMQFAGKDAALFTGDEKCIVLVDATAGSVTVSLKTNSFSVFTGINNTTEGQHVYAGQGRALIMQLEAP